MGNQSSENMVDYRKELSDFRVEVVDKFQVVDNKIEILGKDVEFIKQEVRKTGITTEQINKKLDYALDFIEERSKADIKNQEHEERITCLERDMTVVKFVLQTVPKKNEP